MEVPLGHASSKSHGSMSSGLSPRRRLSNIRAGFRVYIVEFRKTANTSRLVKGGETFRIFLTLVSLLFINDIESVAETIVCEADLFRIPTSRLILRL